MVSLILEIPLCYCFVSLSRTWALKDQQFIFKTTSVAHVHIEFKKVKFKSRLLNSIYFELQKERGNLCKLWEVHESSLSTAFYEYDVTLRHVVLCDLFSIDLGNIKCQKFWLLQNDNINRAETICKYQSLVNLKGHWQVKLMEGKNIFKDYKRKWWKHS